MSTVLFRWTGVCTKQGTSRFFSGPSPTSFRTEPLQDNNAQISKFNDDLHTAFYIPRYRTWRSGSELTVSQTSNNPHWRWLSACSQAEGSHPPPRHRSQPWSHLLHFYAACYWARRPLRYPSLYWRNATSAVCECQGEVWDMWNCLNVLKVLHQCTDLSLERAS